MPIERRNHHIWHDDCFCEFLVFSPIPNNDRRTNTTADNEIEIARMEFDCPRSARMTIKRLLSQMHLISKIHESHDQLQSQLSSQCDHHELKQTSYYIFILKLNKNERKKCVVPENSNIVSGCSRLIVLLAICFFFIF